MEPEMTQRNNHRSSWLLVSGIAMMLSGPGVAVAQDDDDAESTIRLMGAAEAELPEAVTKEIKLPPAARENTAAVDNGKKGLENANEAKENRERGQDRADEARERGAEMAEEARQNRENRGRLDDRPDRPEPPDRPVPPRGPPD